MKFLLRKISKFNSRLGKLTDFSQVSGIQLETPLLLLYTKSGSIPHITREVFELLTREPSNHAVLITLPSTVLMVDALKEFKHGMAAFCGLKDCVTWCCIQDPAIFTPSGYNTKSEISVWSTGGRIALSTQRYGEIMNAMKCDVYESLADCDTPDNSGEKRYRKSVEVSNSMLDRCVSNLPSSSVLVASLVGGHDVGYREKSGKHAQQYLSQTSRLPGVSLHGLHSNGLSSVQNLSMDTLVSSVNSSVGLLGDDTLRSALGCWNPDQLIALVETGVDVFDSSYAYLATERFAALNFKFTAADSEAIKHESRATDYYEFSLLDDRHKESFYPLVEGCTCLTCKKHTRAYIHHLVNVKELLASVLLMIHNLHYFIEFFKFIRKSYDEDKRVFIT